MNELKTFKNEEFGEVRTLQIDNEPWFVGKDVATVLGYKDTSDALKRHVDEEDKLTRCFTDSGQKRDMYIVNESGLYSLILSSKLPNAKQFKRWVTSEILPSIRKTGTYTVGQPQGEALIALAVIEAQKVIERQNKYIEEAKPKVLFADSVSASENTILIGELAKILKGNGISIGQNRLYEWLRNNGYLIRRKGSDYNTPTQKSMELGLFKIKETVINHSDGHTSVNKTTKVTGKGQQYFINVFLKKEIAIV